MISENLINNRKFSWFDIEEPQTEDFSTLSETFSLPQLLVQDTLRPEHLPKYEYSEEGHFLMLRSFDPQSDKNATTIQELTRKIALFITPDRLVTIHRVNLDYLNKVIQRCGKSEAPKTIQELVHLIVLSVLRTYEETIVNLQEVYDEFEAEVLSRKNEKLNFEKIYKFRRQLFVIKRILKQTIDALYRSRDFWENHPSMLQDLKENIDQIYFQLDEVSDNFDHLFQLHISINDQRANEVMKVLTVFSSVLLPLNFIASFYGMNFDYIPGLHSSYSVGVLIIFMVFISFAAIWYFRRKGWFNTIEDEL